MAFKDALFQLGMDLTRSSTAQKEDPCVAAPSAQRLKQEQRMGEGSRPSAQSVGINSSQHVVVDLIGAQSLDSVERVEATLKWAAVLAGSELMHVHLHKLASTGGVAGIASFAGSDISMRTWPDSGRIEVDALIGSSDSWGTVVESLQKAFGAGASMPKQKTPAEQVMVQPWVHAADRKGARARKAKAA